MDGIERGGGEDQKPREKTRDGGERRPHARSYSGNHGWWDWDDEGGGLERASRAIGEGMHGLRQKCCNELQPTTKALRSHVWNEWNRRNIGQFLIRNIPSQTLLLLLLATFALCTRLNYMYSI
jgi:hypothetical protein